MFQKLFQISCLIGLLLVACKKENTKVTTPLKPFVSNFDTANTLKYNLSKGSSHLFSLAIKAAGLDSLLTQKNVFYTLLIPSDSAFLAASLDSTILLSFSKSYLKSLLNNQIYVGNLSDSLLKNAAGYIPFKNFTLSSDMVPSFYFHQEPQGLWVEGKKVTNLATSTKASNGSIYFVNQFFNPPTITAWNIITSRPEFSYFVEAVRINDSIHTALLSPYGSDLPPFIADSSYFGTFQSIPPFVDGIGNRLPATYFVPTNQAFIEANFPSVASLRKYGLSNIKVLKKQVATTFGSIPAGEGTPLDSILASCIIGRVRYLYFDLLYNPLIDNLPSNFFSRLTYNTGVNILIPPYLGLIQTYRQNGTISLRSNSKKSPPFVNIVIKDLVGDYCVVHGVDHLFYPY